MMAEPGDYHVKCYTVTFEIREIAEVPAKSEQEAIAKAWEAVVASHDWYATATEEA